jgi:hypothetical protein
MTTSYADEVSLQRHFWLETVNRYLNSVSPDPEYLAKLMNTAAEWEAKWDEYLAHLRATNTSHHIRIPA